jgi:DNA (cytosine-5)-methyltransferase 1
MFLTQTRAFEGKKIADFLGNFSSWLHKPKPEEIRLAIPCTDDPTIIKQIFEQHFFFKYKSSKGASRLPVLALYAVYQVLVGEVSRYAGKKLAPLNEHSAADSQTGAVGDIEVLTSGGAVFEAVEVKHEIEIGAAIMEGIRSKVMDKRIDRYYVLTTHKNCEPVGLQDGIAQIQKLFGCYVIVNGVVPSLKYYLRLLSKPSDVFPNYVRLLQADKAISHEHRMAWNEVATRLKG